MKLIENFKTIDDVWSEFRVVPQDANILLAVYAYGSYCGDAFVLFEKDGELFEVNASHCSCYGLEGQWTPEATNKMALINRIENGHLGKCEDIDFSQDLKEILVNL